MSELRTMKKSKIIGLIGGMGPYASAYFYKLLLEKSGKDYGAKHNDDYPEIVIDSLPVPDFISNTSQLHEAKRVLISRAKKLKIFGCNIITMVCNTGHILYPDLKINSGTQLISLIDLMKERVKSLKIKRVGLLATKVTIEQQIYHKELKDTGVEIIIPDEKFQEIQENIIRYLIANGGSKDFENILEKITREFIIREHLDGIILGCTELPLVFPKNKFRNVVDCLDVLADSLLANYYLNKKLIS